jgi:glycerophosphoryl diester phosphodiesterase
MLIESGATGEDGTSHDELCTPAGLKRIAEVVEGVGPPIGRIVTWNSTGVGTVTALVKDAHAAGLVVHPYTVRSDALPKHCPSMEALHAALFRGAGIDGVFTDFTDVTRAWLGR